MRKWWFGVAAGVAVLVGGGLYAWRSTLGVAVQAGAGSFHDLQAVGLDGQPVELSRYRGRVLLVVNTASQCGFTPQYEGLEALYQKYRDRGLVVLGFPCNDFGGQEPGAAQQIHEFCSTRFRVTFPLFDKVVVKPGPDQSPVYRFLTAGGQVPSWNFCKYLVGRDGRVLRYYPSLTTPGSAELQKAIEEALAQASPLP
jgi:glutathione peroxidase